MLHFTPLYEYYNIYLDISASRQIRRRVPYAGHLMTPRRLWLNKIPTLCDVVIEFPGIDYNFGFSLLLFFYFNIATILPHFFFVERLENEQNINGKQLQKYD